MSPPDSFIKAHLADTLTQVELLLDYKRIHHGKVRDTFEINNKRILITTDRQSAFDRILADIPFKGQVLNQISEFWFEKTSDIVPNHMIAAPDPNVMIVKKAKVFPVEVIVRGYLTGSTSTSAWVNYSNGVRDFCGVMLPEGMKKNEKFDKAIITPTTKEEDHDRSISPKEIVEQGFVAEEKWKKIEEYAIKVFERGSEIAAENGFILVDTKFEFGEDADGNIMLVDEVLTPDSSRYWRKDTYEEKMSKGEEPDSFDKEFLRLWFTQNCNPYDDKILPKAPDELRIELSKRYIEAYENLTGNYFSPALGSPTPLARIQKNIRTYLEDEGEI
ncbi:MAG: phosphoribosylaminoimidazolesuccinocarboxamide synthase [Candidatus Gracilibacteria bacterium]|jgi:phosphoribosylaminoimidazole-succinocarboxamide synthase|nr:phosphoribosylaminoimidazolesuccinocarboxamide synthase [Candidatus Gracilibacteria bacterium]